MCGFTHEIESVADTKLINIVYRTAQGERRMTQVYGNKVKLVNGNQRTSMILPVPASGGVDSINLEMNKKTMYPASKYLFEDLQLLFNPPPQTSTFTLGGLVRSLGGESSTLAVVRAGSYMVTKVPSLADLARLDPAVFGDNQQFTKLLSDTARECEVPMSFLAFRLDESAEFTPFVYDYSLGTQTKGFIPTKHFHPKPASVVPQWHFGSAQPVVQDHEWADDWDHNAMLVGVDGMIATSGTIWRQLPTNGSIDIRIMNMIGSDNFKQVAQNIVIKGRHKNIDLTFPLEPGLSAVASSGALTPPVGPGIWCNICNRVGLATRMHCLTCADYDVCMTCFSAGKHQAQMWMSQHNPAVCMLAEVRNETHAKEVKRIAEMKRIMGLAKDAMTQ